MSELFVPKIGICASGEGTTADAYAKAIHAGEVNHEIAVVVSNKENAGIFEKVERWNSEYGFNTETAVINQWTHPRGSQGKGQTTEEAEAISDLMEEHGVGTIALLGYMKIVNQPLTTRWGFIQWFHKSMYEARMINTHPGPLPETANTYGLNTSAKVLELGLTKSKHTMHIVAQDVDRGPVFVEYPVDVLPGDTAETLNARTQQVEKANIAKAIDNFIRKKKYFDSMQ